jgi:hypothetical protein
MRKSLADTVMEISYTEITSTDYPGRSGKLPGHSNFVSVEVEFLLRDNLKINFFDVSQN